MLAMLPFVLSLLAAQDSPPASAAPAGDPVRTTIARAIRWIERQAVPVPGHEGAVLFPESAESRGHQDAQIYGGTAGVLLFLENAAAALDDAQARKLADAAAKGLLATRGTTPSGGATWMPAGMREGAVGLYTGDAGVGHAFLTRSLLRGDKEALAVAVEIGDSIVARGIAKGDQISWDQQVEIIYGASGTILFLLELGEATGDESYANTAHAAARWLLGKAIATTSARDPKQRLLSWRWQLAGDSPYVNFSHGTAGVAYALARVGAATEDET